MSAITESDYKKILEFYEKPIPRSKRLLKIEAEKILATKLCKCIKKVDVKNEARSIGICTKSVINTKGFTRGKFKCKGKKYITFRKTSQKKTQKNRK